MIWGYSFPVQPVLYGKELDKERKKVAILVSQADSGRQPVRWMAFLFALLMVATCTSVDWLLYSHTDLANLVMVYLLGVLITAYLQGMGASIMASVLSVFSFDYFFVPPRFTLPAFNL